MTQTDFASDPSPAPVPAEAASGPAGAPPQRPGFVPEKFWDGEAGCVRIEDLANSYRALERKLGRAAATRADETDAPPPAMSESAREAPEGADPAQSAGAEAPPTPPRGDEDTLDTAIPATPEDYAVKVSHPWLGRDGEIDGFLHAAGFNQSQAQLVYDLAAERVVPVIERMAAEFERRLAQAKLESHFGGAERFAGIARQVKAWGERHLPKPLYDTLSASPDGIAALHHMMRAGEPRLLGGEAPAAGPSQNELDALVRDPRYWRDHDPQLVKRVEEGFRRLYPGA